MDRINLACCAVSLADRLLADFYFRSNWYLFNFDAFEESSQDTWMSTMNVSTLRQLSHSNHNFCSFIIIFLSKSLLEDLLLLLLLLFCC